MKTLYILQLLILTKFHVGLNVIVDAHEVGSQAFLLHEMPITNHHLQNTHTHTKPPDAFVLALHRELGVHDPLELRCSHCA